MLRSLFLFHALQIKLHEDTGVLKTKCVLKKFADFSGKHLRCKTSALQTLRLATLLKRDSNTAIFI